MDHISYYHNAMLNVFIIYRVVAVAFFCSSLISCGPFHCAFVLLFTLLIPLFWIVIHNMCSVVRWDRLCCLYSVTWITIENLCSLENSVYSLIAHVFLSLTQYAHTHKHILTNRHILYIVYQIPNRHTHTSTWLRLSSLSI